MRARALFLDRDGVVNEEGGYLHRADEVRFVDGIFSLCRTAAVLGYRLIVVTNQAGIARGYYSEPDFEALMEFMRGELRAEGVELGESVLVGDRCSDVGAANAAGLRQAFLISGTEAAGCGGEYVMVESL